MTRTAENVSTQENTKGEQTMENKTEKKAFNEFDYVKSNVLFAYFKNNEKELFNISLNGTYNTAIKWLNETQAVEISNPEFVVDETGKRRIQYQVKMIDIDKEATSKTGKKFYVFNAKQVVGIKRYCKNNH